ncbi:MAG: NUMOD3 domain-containing DNA-binding protein [Candidatus Nanoarchaeia archaeon]|nr:NUMOD3 domain-containing DNA-binding protein [Candidatus Nanoarchaeia archaeon]MDD5587778.1 NUMOD3 domain-containing DNA-binding protein [Candidatus Nanoarchaeia archaeon]
MIKKIQMRSKEVNSLLRKNIPNEKKVKCLICGKKFRNRYVYAGHAKVHFPQVIENIKKRMLTQNPAKRLDVRKKISKAISGRKAWNKGQKWSKDLRHNKITDRTAKTLKRKGYKVLTTH